MMEGLVDTYLEFMEFVDQLARKFLIAVTAAMTLTIIVQVLFRYILKDPLVWTEELARYLMIWMAFVGASCVIKKWQNIYVDFFIDKLTPRRRRIAYFVQKLVVFAVLLYTLLLAAEVIPTVAGNQVTAAMGVSMMWAQSSIIAGLLLMVLQNVGVLLDDLFNVKVFGKGGRAMTAFWIVTAVLMTAIVAGLPIAFAIGMTTIMYMLMTMPENLSVIPLRMFAGIDSFILMALPLFVLGADIMVKTGISDKLFQFVKIFVGRLQGGLAYVNVLSATIFGAISGAALSDVAALGKVNIDGMVKAGYPRDFACGLTAGASIQDPLIPPSNIAVLYGGIMSLSVGTLLIAGFIPGLVLALLEILWIFVNRKRLNMPKGCERFTLKQKLEICKGRYGCAGHAGDHPGRYREGVLHADRSSRRRLPVRPGRRFRGLEKSRHRDGNRRPARVGAGLGQPVHDHFVLVGVRLGTRGAERAGPDRGWPCWDSPRTRSSSC